MRLNPDCLRDVLLCVEENTGLRNYAQFINASLYEQSEDFFDEHIEIPEYQKILLLKYSCDELIYHVRYCAESKLIEESDVSNDICIVVTDLTPSGHEFLSKIRDAKQWRIIKKGLSAVGDYSLAAISAIAEGATSAGIGKFISALIGH